VTETDNETNLQSMLISYTWMASKLEATRPTGRPTAMPRPQRRAKPRSQTPGRGWGHNLQGQSQTMWPRGQGHLTTTLAGKFWIRRCRSAGTLLCSCTIYLRLNSATIESVCMQFIWINSRSSSFR